MLATDRLPFSHLEGEVFKCIIAAAILRWQMHRHSYFVKKTRTSVLLWVSWLTRRWEGVPEYWHVDQWSDS